MRNKLWRSAGGALALAAVALVGAAVAFAGSGHRAHAATTPAHTPETPLTGDVAAKATAAAVAKVGGTADIATTENDGTNTAAAYEVHVTKTDGTHVTVVLDKNFTVLTVETGRPGGPGHPGPGGPGGPGNGETPLTGDVAAKATAAAVAKVGGTADIATTENDGTSTGAAYEVHVTKTDGTHVTVVLDKNFTVLTVETRGPGGPGGPGHPGPGGPGGPGNGETPLTGDVATKAAAAAVAKVGGTADFATTENDGTNAAAAYEVHVTKTDGTHVTVILDKNFTVLTVETHP